MLPSPRGGSPSVIACASARASSGAGDHERPLVDDQVLLEHRHLAPVVDDREAAFDPAVAPGDDAPGPRSPRGSRDRSAARDASAASAAASRPRAGSSLTRSVSGVAPARSRTSAPTQISPSAPGPSSASSRAAGGTARRRSARAARARVSAAPRTGGWAWAPARRRGAGRRRVPARRVPARRSSARRRQATQIGLLFLYTNGKTGQESSSLLIAP